MLEVIGDLPERQGLNGGSRLFFRPPVCRDAREGRMSASQRQSSSRTYSIASENLLAGEALGISISSDQSATT